MRPQRHLLRLLFLFALACLSKNPAYGQLDSAYRQEGNDAKALGQWCGSSYNNSRLGYAGKRIVIDKATNQIFLLTLNESSNTCFIESIHGVTPAYLNRESADVIKGSKYLYKFEGSELILYKRPCASCSIVRSVVGEPLPQ